NTQMPIWWKVRVARKAATKPSNNRVAEVERVSDADRAIAFPRCARPSDHADLSTITRCADRAYPTQGPLRRIDRGGAAVGHRRAAASVGHTKTPVWSPYVRLAPKSGKVPQE